MKYKNYGVVVTGGGHGIGKAIIEEFVREGAKVCFIDINADYGNSLVSESVFFFHGDVSLEDDLNQFICFCKEKLERILKENEIFNVFLRGSTNKVQEKLDESGIFIMTSNYEGYPISTIEAMRRGLPIVLRNTFEAAQDIVIDNGILLEKEWDEDKFVEAVRKVYDNYEYYSENSKKLGERYSPEVIKKEWDEILEEE